MKNKLTSSSPFNCLINQKICLRVDIARKHYKWISEMRRIDIDMLAYIAI